MSYSRPPPPATMARVVGGGLGSPEKSETNRNLYLKLQQPRERKNRGQNTHMHTFGLEVLRTETRVNHMKLTGREEKTAARKVLGSRRSKKNRARRAAGGDFSQQQPHKREGGMISRRKSEYSAATGRRKSNGMEVGRVVAAGEDAMED